MSIYFLKNPTPHGTRHENLSPFLAHPLLPLKRKDIVLDFLISAKADGSTLNACRPDQQNERTPSLCQGPAHTERDSLDVGRTSAAIELPRCYEVPFAIGRDSCDDC